MIRVPMITALSLRRYTLLALLAATFFAVACTNKKVTNPLADVNSKQPDKVLFDRALDALKHNKFDVARLTLQTLINTYPDSEFIARAKLGVGDSWYAESGSAALTQAEIEYKDFITFFPNMPEAAEAQYKIAGIHFQQMEKPDRDFTHALRAEEEYRQMVLQFPDSKLVPQAKSRLREVQEILAEREFRVGRFYYMRESYPASIARLKSVIDKYPLYSSADNALFTLGQAFEGEMDSVRSRPGNEIQKARFMQGATDDAAHAYKKIIERYPLAPRVAEATQRLLALHRPVPTPTAEAIANNKKEIDSREELGMMDRLMGQFKKHPEVALATRTGEPTLVDPKMYSAIEVARDQARAMGQPVPGENKLTVETIKSGAPPANEAAPRSDAPITGTAAPSPGAEAAPAGVSVPAVASPYGELKPETPQTPDAAPGVPPDAAAPAVAPPAAPAQTNELAQPEQAAPPAPSSVSGPPVQDDRNSSSSRSKKKKGLKKVLPF